MVSKAEIAIVSSVMALLRGDVSASYIADQFGVTEAQVNEWKDIFVVAGVLALTRSQEGHQIPQKSRHAEFPEFATTTPLATTPHSHPRYATTIVPCPTKLSVSKEASGKDD
jgi:hypothetical protein